MKTANRTMGILAIVLFLFNIFILCILPGIVFVIGFSDFANIAFCAFLIMEGTLLIAGIIGIEGQNSIRAGITAGVFCIIASLMASLIAILFYINENTIAYVFVLPAVVSLGFGLIFIIDSVKMKRIEQLKKTEKTLLD